MGDGSIGYEVTGGGKAVMLPGRNVFHLPGLGFDGYRGYSVVGMARRSLGLATTAELAGEGFFANGMRPGGWIQYEGSLQDLQKMNMKEAIKTEYGGATKFGKTLLLYGGLKYNELTINPGDAQFLETRQFQTVEIARWFNLPPHKIRDLSRATFSNIEHQGAEFVTDTLMYWLTKIAQEWKRKLLARDQDQYAEHNVEALMRGDTIARYTAYGIARQWGFYSPNDCRRKENMPPIPGGDVYHVPVNMAPLGSEPTPAGPVDPKQAPEPPPNPGQKATARGPLVAFARDLLCRDADELEGVARDHPDMVARWAASAGPEDWGWVPGGVAGWMPILSATWGDPIGPGAVADRYVARQLWQVKDLAHAANPRDAALDLAARWRGDEAEVADLIVKSLDL